MNPALRPMSTSELLDRTFNLYRNKFVLFAGIAAFTPALALIVQLLGVAAGVPTDPESASRMGPDHLGPILGFLVLELFVVVAIYMLAGQLVFGATVYGVSMCTWGKPTTISAAFKHIRPYWGRLVGVFFLIFIRMVGVGILIAVSFVLGWLALLALPFLVWWMIYLYARYSLAGAACVLENQPAEESLKRSWFLTEKSTGRIWLIFLLTGILGAVLGTALGIPAQLLKLMHHGEQTLGVAVSALLGQFLAQTLASPIATISLVLIYYDQRVRKEAFDLQVMMQALEPTAQSPAASPSAPI